MEDTEQAAPEKQHTHGSNTRSSHRAGKPLKSNMCVVSTGQGDLGKTERLISKCINVEKEELSKHELETMDFGSLEDEFGQEMSFNIGISVDDDSGVDLVPTVEVARRHRSLDQDELDEISKANTDVATDYQTKWAVKICTQCIQADIPQGKKW